MSEKKLNKKLIIIVSIIAAVALIATVAVIVMLSHRETVGDVLDLGDRYMSELDYESAIREYKRAIEIDPKAEDAYLKLAEAYIALGDVDSAIKALEDGYAATQSERILARLNELRGGGADSGVHSPDDAESIVMASTPQKTTYNVGDVLDLTGLTLTVTYSDGATEVVSDGYTCEVGTLDEAGTQEVTVRYGGAETKFTVTVEDVEDVAETEPPVTEPPVTEPPVTEPPVTEPPVTEPPVTEPPVTEPPVTEPPETKPPVPVTFSSISIRTNPSKTTYQVGETLDTSGLSLTATYSDGHSETVTSGFSCSPTSLGSAGEQTITVTYSGKTTAFVVKVEAAKQESHSGTWGDLSWTLDGDGVLTISGDGEMKDFDDISGSWREYRGSIKTVVISSGITSIAKDAFWDCEKLITVTIPNSITYIGSEAFFNCGLTAIQLPRGIEEIGERAFASCGGLKSIFIPSSLIKWNSAFADCTGLTSVQIESGISTIPNGAFWCCENLTEVNIPNSITCIEEHAFFNCGFTSLTIPNNVTEMGPWVFAGCENLKEVKIESNILGEWAFDSCSSLKSITIPKQLVKWGSAFAGCSGLTDVQFAGEVQEIPDGAFFSCRNIKSITIPSSVKSIGESAFFGTESLSDIYIENGSCDILDSYGTLGVPGTTTIHGYAGSTAEKYAQQWGYAFEPIG